MTERPVGADAAVHGALASARALGFLGPGPIEDHVRHAEAYLPFVPVDVAAGERPALDLGSGGGVPGLVLACRLPGSTWVLLDSNRRRTSFLAGVLPQLGLADRVQVLRARAEDVGHDAAHRGQYGAVVARSFGPPAMVAEVSAPLLAPNGRLLVAEPPGADDRWPASGIREVGLELVERQAEPVGIVVLQRAAECPSGYPRPWPRQRRAPLF